MTAGLKKRQLTLPGVVDEAARTAIAAGVVAYPRHGDGCAAPLSPPAAAGRRDALAGMLVRPTHGLVAATPAQAASAEAAARADGTWPREAS